MPWIGANGRDLCDVERSLRARNRSVRTIGNYLDSASALAAFQPGRSLTGLRRGELVDVSPMAGMRPPEIPEKPIRVLTDDELRALFVACEGRLFAERRDAALFRLMLEPGGLRLGEGPSAPPPFQPQPYPTPSLTP